MARGLWILSCLKILLVTYLILPSFQSINSLFQIQWSNSSTFWSNPTAHPITNSHPEWEQLLQIEKEEENENRWFIRPLLLVWADGGWRCITRYRVKGEGKELMKKKIKGRYNWELWEKWGCVSNFFQIAFNSKLMFFYRKKVLNFSFCLCLRVVLCKWRKKKIFKKKLELDYK